jgi:hypothetical protein
VLCPSIGGAQSAARYQRRRREARGSTRPASRGQRINAPAGPRRGLGRARLLQRRKAAGARAKRHDPSIRTLAAAAAAGRRQRRPRAAPRPRALHMPANDDGCTAGHGATNGEGGRGISHLGSSINHRAGAGSDFLPRPPATGGRKVRDRLLCCTGPKHGSRLVRSGGAARTKCSRRPPRWKHARRGCLADSDPAGDGRRQYVGGPDAPHSLAGLDAHAQAIGMREARRTVPSLPSERHRIPMHTTARRADSSRRHSPSR